MAASSQARCRQSCEFYNNDVRHFSIGHPWLCLWENHVLVENNSLTKIMIVSLYLLLHTEKGLFPTVPLRLLFYPISNSFFHLPSTKTLSPRMLHPEPPQITLDWDIAYLSVFMRETFCRWHELTQTYNWSMCRKGNFGALSPKCDNLLNQLFPGSDINAERKWKTFESQREVWL